MNALLRQQNWQPNPIWKDVLEPEDEELLSYGPFDRMASTRKPTSFTAIESSITDEFVGVKGHSCNESLSSIRCVPFI